MKQDILAARDKLRTDIEQLDAGYVSVGKLMGKTKQHVQQALAADNRPRLKTLEDVKSALVIIQKEQQERIDKILT